MKWSDDLPDRWEDCNQYPPRIDRGTKSEPLSGGMVVRDLDRHTVYIYSSETVDVVP